MNLRKPLDEAARKRFGETLKARVLEWVGNDPERRAMLARALKKRGTVRLDYYAIGTHYPMPEVLRRLAAMIGVSWLALYAEAGYQRELLLPLYRLTQRQPTEHELRFRQVLDSARGVSPPAENPWPDIAVQFSVGAFPRRNESFAAANFYAIAIGQSLVEDPLRDEAQKERLRGDSVRDALPPLLKRAYDVLIDDKYPASLRSEHAADFVRGWACEVSPSAVDSAERLFYNSGPLSIRPTGPFARVRAPIELGEKSQHIARDSQSHVGRVGKPTPFTLQVKATELEHETKKADPSR